MNYEFLMKLIEFDETVFLEEKLISVITFQLKALSLMFASFTILIAIYSILVGFALNLYFSRLLF